MAAATLTECCTSTPTAPPPSVERLASTLKALADPVRLRLLSFLAAQDDDEACVCDLTAPVDLSQPTVSHHLRVLVEAELVTREQRGRWAYYRLERSALARVGAAVVDGLG